MEENYKRLDIYNKDIIEKFDGMYVDFYLEDDMFEIEGQFFTIDGQLYIEVHDSVMHILEMAGKELRVGQVGELFTATRPDNHRFYMEINRVYYLMENPAAADFILPRPGSVKVQFLQKFGIPFCPHKESKHINSPCFSCLFFLSPHIK